jgi:hypothetical protein
MLHLAVICEFREGLKFLLGRSQTDDLQARNTQGTLPFYWLVVLEMLFPPN